MKDVVLVGPICSEFFWEFFRVAPHVLYLKKKKYNNAKIIILTREERFDIYGKMANILVPLQIPGDYIKYWPNCHRLMGLVDVDYHEIAQIFKKKYSKKYNIVDHIYPDVTKAHFCNKNQYQRTQMIYEWFPRERNKELVNDYLPTDKPLVVISPRYRGDLKRNWPHWKPFFDMVADDTYLMKTFNFILCGKEGEYIPDKQRRFLDLNDIKLDKDSSLAGLLLATISKAFFTVGSQSAIPNISLLYGVEALEFGHQNLLHTKIYNVKNTPVTFLNDPTYMMQPKVLFDNFKKRLRKKEK